MQAWGSGADSWGTPCLLSLQWDGEVIVVSLGLVRNSEMKRVVREDLKELWPAAGREALSGLLEG